MYPLVYFIRHGQTAWNAEQRLQGQADTDITARGRSQADRNGRRLAELIDRPAEFDFVASPLRRTRETMERVRVAMGLPAQGYRTDARLVEVHFGDWQGFTLAEVEASAPGSTAARARDKWDFVPPGDEGESYEMLLARVRPWFDELERPTVCVTHGGILRVAFRLVEAMPATDAAALEIPQDRVLRLRGGRLDWL
ncbi:putative phosphoglycerate mutase [Pseudaminobacter salicylatoxidans]|uniref:Putative phosphoglycerate mutase n=1 Tax=Pseudaminobacter salicylatoxidans TaxID=93369 RepID=A0A316C6S9_PSESE|nr:histidine phosphatase family protein [Pseudaminobacter salicylatoxidans]PWJ85440.1 putative phosphoglycerate mutase [Pseudaminobacter salicylatoxidans]